MADEIKLLTALEILNKPDLTDEYVPVPEWGGTVRVREAMADERERYENTLMNIVVDEDTGKAEAKRGVTPAKVLLVSLCCIDKDGKRVFSESQVRQLALKSSVAINRVFDVIARLSLLRFKDVKDAEKNSSGAVVSASTTTSPDSSAG